MVEHIVHLRRHLVAREPLFVGEEIIVPGTSDKAMVGNGVHPDTQAHLTADQYAIAEQIGESLYVPSEVSSLLIAPSPLARAVETATYNFVGMARAYARSNLGVGEKLTPEQQKVLSEKGLHKKAVFRPTEGLVETTYKNSAGKFDDGNELVAEAYHPGINPHFAGYKWMVQKGFENDPRSEHPQQLADRALKQLVPSLLQYDVVLSASHQPNLEVITAALIGNLGKDANELWDIAGGGYGMGGGLELRIYETDGKITGAQLRRNNADPKKLDKELTVSVDVLREYL